MEKPRDSRPDVKAVAEALRAAQDGAALSRALAETDLEKLSTNDYGTLARALQARAPGAPRADVKIAYLSNFTIDLLPRYIDVHLAREGLTAASYVGGFDQYVQEVLEESSGLSLFKPDFVVLALSLRLLRRGPWTSFHALAPAERREVADEIVDHVEAWAAAAAEHLPSTFLIANFPAPPLPAAGVADLNADYGETEFFLDLNLSLLRRFKGNRRVHVFDLDRLASRYGKDRVLDRKMYYLAKMEWSAGFLPCVAGELVRHVKAVQGLTRKCVVLDLDNTLWGGVVGEEGPAGIKIGPGDPEGEAFLDFHHKLKALHSRGILLAVCSKNNPPDVLEVFRTRPEIPLRLEDFAALEIGWEPKHQGLGRIAQALNVGVDSLVFVDDNPAEIALIQQMLPEVRTLLLPPDPAEYAAALERLTDFEKAAILAEDLEKTEQYRENRARDELRLSAADLSSYLASLGTEVAVRRARHDDLARVHQLFNKTNQFNLTTRRYSPGDLERFASSPDCELWVARAHDRFGDLGTIAVVLLQREGRLVHVDSFLMSCRAMGRGIETAIMNHIKARLREDRNGYELRGRFIPTAKNKPVETFYDDQGFRLLEIRDGGEKLYALRRDEAVLKPCEWIRVVQDEMVMSR